MMFNATHTNSSIPATQQRRARAAPKRKQAQPRRSDRVVRAPMAVGRVVSSVGTDRVPTMSARGRNTRIVHVERFTDVTTTSTALEVRTFSINPGLNNVFPWLCDIANRFEKYKFSQLAFRYVPQSAAVAGNVTLAFDFDPNDLPPASMSEATTYHDYVSSSVWNPVVLKPDIINGDRLPQKNTRPALPAGDIDLNVYDVGQLHILTEGAVAATTGYVEVMYTLDLFIHQIQDEIGGDLQGTAGLDATHLVGTTVNSDAQANLPVEVTSSAALTFIQPWEGLLCCWQAGVGLGTDFALNPSGGAAASLLRQAGTSTSVCSVWRVKAPRGGKFTPTITMGTSLAKSTFEFGGGKYAQYSLA